MPRFAEIPRLTWRRGGIWTAKKIKDPCNPDINNPKQYDGTVLTLLGGDETDNRVEPDAAEFAAALKQILARAEKLRSSKRADVDVAASLAQGYRFGKSLTIGKLSMQQYLKDPETMNEVELIQAATAIKGLCQAPMSGQEQQGLKLYTARLLKSLNDVKEARARLVKAADAAPPPSRAQGKTVNDKGKVAYDYEKKQGGKAADKIPASKRGLPGPGKAEDAQEGQPQEDPEAISQPPAVDPTAVAGAIGVSPEELKNLAKMKTREGFIQWFMAKPAMVQQLKLDQLSVGKLYDALVTQQPQPKQGAGGPPKNPLPATGGAAAAKNQANMLNAQKSISFLGSAQDVATQTILDLCKAHKAASVGDVCDIMQRHFATDEWTAERMTHTILNKFERQGIVAFGE